jgi:hypothetical protein
MAEATCSVTLTMHSIRDDPTVILVGIHAAPTTVCTPLDLVCVGDISGSMGSIVTKKDGEGNVVNHGFTRLNLVQHAIRSVATSLNKENSETMQMGLTTFHTFGEVILPILQMSETNLGALNIKVDQIVPRDNTNIWSGLEKALGLFPVDQARMMNLPWVLLQSDGYDNVNPTGVLTSLRKWKATHGYKLMPLISTIGFTEFSESIHLKELADEGKGVYAYVHDASLVGPVFNNMVANMWVTLGVNLSFSINGVECKHLPDVGPILAGQSKYVRLPRPERGGIFTDNVTVVLTYNDARNGCLPFHVVASNWSILNEEEAAAQLLRHQFVELVGEATLTAEYNMPGAITLVEKFMALANTGPYRNTPKHKAYFQDAREALLALQNIVAANDLLKRNPRMTIDQVACWGFPHLRNVVQGYHKQLCLDSKNLGLSYYTSPFRDELFQRLSDAFNELPPPIASGRVSSTVAVAAPVTNMSSYNSTSYDDPCFAGWSMVKLGDGSSKRVDEVKKGDVMFNGGIIVCVLKTITTGGKARLINLPDRTHPGEERGLYVTPHHPIRSSSSEPFKYPVNVGRELGDIEVSNYRCSAIYSFVLDRHHVMEINGYQCVTLGHGFQDAVSKHDYFGTECVLNDLRKLDEYEVGLIVAGKSPMRRNVATGWIDGFHAAFVQPVC